MNALVFTVTVHTWLNHSSSYNVEAADDVKARAKAVAKYKVAHSMRGDKIAYCEVTLLGEFSR